MKLPSRTRTSLFLVVILASCSPMAQRPATSAGPHGTTQSGMTTPAGSTATARPSESPPWAATLSAKWTQGIADTTPTLTPISTISLTKDFLSPSGPWLALAGTSGVWAMNEDGTGLSRLTALPYIGPRSIHRAVSHAGAELAFTTLTDDFTKRPSLALLSFPEGTVKIVSSLMNSDPPEGDDFPEEWLDLYASVAKVDTLSWSPDGEHLAFVAAIEGPSSDLYLYEPPADAVKRLTSGPTLAVDPEWSPNGSYILHGSATALNYEAAPSGYSMTGYWAAAEDGSGVHLLFQSKAHGSEQVAGWLSSTLFLARTLDFPCSNNGLREVSLITGITRTLWTGEFADAALAPGQKTVLLAMPADPGGLQDYCTFLHPPGYYMIDVQSAEARLLPGLFVDPGEFPRVEWSAPLSSFMVSSGQGLSLVTLDGRVSSIADPPCPHSRAISPDGTYIATVTCEGLWVGAVGHSGRTIYEGEAAWPTWSPRGDRLYFLTNLQVSSLIAPSLYSASAPSFEAQALYQESGLNDINNAPVWIIP